MSLNNDFDAIVSKSYARSIGKTSEGSSDSDAVQQNFFSLLPAVIEAAAFDTDKREMQNDGQN